MCAYSGELNVALFTGAWIETLLARYAMKQTLRRALYGRVD